MAALAVERSMHCPRDKAGLLCFVDSKPEVHTCPQCEGVWLPNKTLRRIFADRRLAGTKFGDLVKGWLACEPLPDRHCATCRQTRLLVCKIAAVEVDFCPKCNGVWLDRGELAELKQWHAGQKRRWPAESAGFLSLATGRRKTLPDIFTVLRDGLLEGTLQIIADALFSGI